MGFKKRGQLKLSFGMIFSIILIIIFIGFAFYAIKFFLGLQGQANTGKLVTDLQSNVDTIWKSSQSSQTFEYQIPKDVEFICFTDFTSDGKGINSNIFSGIKDTVFGEGNFVLYYGQGSLETKSFEIEHINILETTSEENPFCLRKNSGKISVLMEKGFSDALVTVKRV